MAGPKDPIDIERFDPASLSNPHPRAGFEAARRQAEAAARARRRARALGEEGEALGEGPTVGTPLIVG